MKQKILVMLLMLVIAAWMPKPAFGDIEPKIEIFGSIYGVMSDPGSWKEFSCIMSNGQINKLKYQDYMRTFKTYGATSTRECPFLVHADHTTITENYMPYLYRDGKYDLDQYNPLYFHNLVEMARIANGEGVIFYFSFFGPDCNRPTSPWVINHQGIEGIYDLSLKAYHYHLNWVYKVIETLQGYDVGYELYNEPTDIRFITDAPGIMDLLQKCRVPKERIILGVCFQEHKLYQGVKNILKHNKTWDKRLMFSKIVHRVTSGFFKKYWRWQKKWDRCFISDYGCSPSKSAQFWNNVLREWFRVVRLKRNKFFKTRSAFEHIYRYPGDDITGVYGIAKAVEDVYGIKMYTRGPILSETVFAWAGWRDVTFSETADGFTIKIKGKWYEIVWKILKAIWEVLTGKE